MRTKGVCHGEVRGLYETAPADEVWRLVGGWNALSDWHPVVKKSEIEQGSTSPPFAARRWLGDHRAA